MKPKEALDILTQVTAQLQATRQVHETIAEALRTLAEATAPPVHLAHPEPATE